MPGDHIGADVKPNVASNEGPSPMGSRRGRARQRRREGRNRTFDSAELSRSQGPVSALPNTKQKHGEIPTTGGKNKLWQQHVSHTVDILKEIDGPSCLRGIEVEDFCMQDRGLWKYRIMQDMRV